MMKSPNRLPAALRRCQRYGIPAAFIFALMFHGLLPSGGWCFEVRELLTWTGQAIDFGGSSFSCGIDVDCCRRDSKQRVLPSRARFSGLHTLNVPLRNGGSAGRWKRRNDLS